MVPAGLIERPEFLTAEEETALLAAVNAGRWDTSLSRRVQHYGHRYNYRYTGKETAAEEVTPVPAWALCLYEKIAACVSLPAAAEDLQVIVNEYVPGQGIRAHVDDPSKFGEWVVTVSLGSGCEMEFARKEEKYRVRLEPRSVYVMTGESRYKWTHAIAGRKTDPGPPRIPRTTRVSVTFRALKR